MRAIANPVNSEQLRAIANPVNSEQLRAISGNGIAIGNPTCIPVYQFTVKGRGWFRGNIQCDLCVSNHERGNFRKFSQYLFMTEGTLTTRVEISSFRQSFCQSSEHKFFLPCLYFKTQNNYTYLYHPSIIS